MTKTAREIREELKKRREKEKGGKGDWFGVKPDTTRYIRNAPPWKKGGDFWKEVLIHGFYKDKVYCKCNDIDKETGKPKRCLVCTRVKELSGDRSPFGKKLWSLIKQRMESLWNIYAGRVKRSESGKLIFKGYEDSKAKKWRLSSQWHDLMVEFYADDDYREKSVLGISHPKYGRWVKVKRVGEERDTKYTFSIVDEGKLPSLLAPTKMKRRKLLETMTDLDSIVHGSSKEELEAFLEKMEKKAKKAVLKEKHKGHSEDEEEEEEEDEEDLDTAEDEEDEDEEKEDEEEGEDVEEEDEDEEDEMERRYKKVKKDLAGKRHREEDEEDDDE